jgi:hypothetical protein
MLTDKLEAAMKEYRLVRKLTPEEYRRARTVDVELLLVLETLAKRLEVRGG